MKLGKILFSSVLVVLLALGVAARADSSLGFAAGGGVTADGSLTGDISTATLFTFASLTDDDPPTGVPDTQTSVIPATGIFASIVPGTFIESTSLDLGAAGGTSNPFLTLSLNGYHFVATSLTHDTFGPNGRLIDLAGEINGPPGFTTVSSTFSLAFTQAGGPGNTIGYGGTLATPLNAIPEPASLGMLALGGLALVGVASRRRASRV